MSRHKVTFLVFSLYFQKYFNLQFSICSKLLILSFFSKKDMEIKYYILTF